MAATIENGSFRVTAASESTPAMSLNAFAGGGSQLSGIVVSGTLTTGTIALEVQTPEMKARNPNDWVPASGGEALDSLGLKTLFIAGALGVRVTTDGSFAGDLYIEGV